MFRKFCSIFILLFLTTSSVWATHIVGGEFSLLWKGRGYNYQLSLNVYYDDIHADDGLLGTDLIIYADVFEKGTNKQVQTFQLPRVSANQFVKYHIPNCQTGSVRTRILHYTSSIYLDPAIYDHPDGYYIVWQRCCRNEVIDNIVEPDNVGNAFYMEFPPVQLNGEGFINSSPEFNDIAGEYFCLNSEQVFDFGAQDLNGDSLVYSLVTPYAGHGNLTSIPGSSPSGLPAPYPLVEWNTQDGYSLKNIIPGSPSLSIDRFTGQLSVTPTKEGLFVLTVMVEEYRNDIRIGLNRRDFQFKVIKCIENPQPEVQLQNPEGGYLADDDTLVVKFGQDSCFVLDITDSSAYKESENISVKLLSENSSSLFSLSASAGVLSPTFLQMTSDLCVTTCERILLEKDSIFQMKVVVSDDGCPVPQTDTLSVNVLILADTNQAPDIGFIPDKETYTITVGDSVSFDVFLTDSDSSDILYLELEGNGFNPGAVGMIFNNVSGIDSIGSKFSWVTNCDHAKNGPYTVTFRGRDESCSKEHEVEKQVVFNIEDKHTEITSIQPVNLITPNGDGENECFYIPDIPEGNCQYFFSRVGIYNRWGAEVFASFDPNFKWKATDVPDGVYFYVIDLNEKTYRGWIEIIR